MTTLNDDVAYSQEALDEVLDQALTRLSAGDDAGSILAAYPSYANELAPLLIVAGGLAPLQDSPALAPEQLATGRRRMLEAAARGRQGGIAGRLARFRAAAQLRLNTGLRAHPLAAAVAALLLVAVSAGGGAVAASSDSLPGSPLYSVKLATEQVQILMAPNEHAQSDLKTQFEERRQHEQEELERREADATPPAKGLARTATVTRSKPADATRTPRPEKSDDPERKASATARPTEPKDTDETETPAATRTPRATETPEPERKRTPESTPTVPGTPKSTPSLRASPYPTHTPELERTPAATRTPAPSLSATPGASASPSPQITPDKN